MPVFTFSIFRYYPQLYNSDFNTPFFPLGVKLTISLEKYALGIEVTVVKSGPLFNATKGLLGTLNDVPDDDLTDAYGREYYIEDTPADDIADFCDSC